MRGRRRGSEETDGRKRKVRGRELEGNGGEAIQTASSYRDARVACHVRPRRVCLTQTLFPPLTHSREAPTWAWGGVASAPPYCSPAPTFTSELSFVNRGRFSGSVISNRMRRRNFQQLDLAS